MRSKIFGTKINRRSCVAINMLESGVRDTMTDIAAIWAGERIKKKNSEETNNNQRMVLKRHNN